MRQIQLDAPGPPEVLHVVEVDAPVPGRGEVLVHTDAAAITFIETQVRAGRSMRPGAEPLALPAVLGNGVEGTIAAVGDGVDGSLIGTRVVTATGGMGGYAEQVVVPVGDPIPVPAGLATGEAAALLADGRTALGLVRAAEPVPGDRVVITGAGGGVGTLLVQLVAQAGVASIVALASSEAKRALALGLGATVAVDPTASGWPDRVAASIGTATLVFDGVSGATGLALAELTEPGGRIVRFGAASGEWADGSAAEARGVRTVFGLGAIASPADNRALVVDALDRAASGSLRVTIGQRFPFDQAAQAHAAIESRATIGKTLLIP
jgi:NADPH2:quinone reductase